MRETDPHCLATVTTLFECAGIRHIAPNGIRFLHYVKHQGITKRENEWLEKHPSMVAWYRDLRGQIITWANAHEINQPDCKIMLQIARHLGSQFQGDLLQASLKDIKEAIMLSAEESFKDPRSLVTLRRQSRDKNEAPGINIARRHSHAALALCQYLNVALDESARRSLLPPRLHHILVQRLRVNEVDAEDFVDEVAGADAIRALQMCQNDREHIVMLMMCRLGMRRGAVQGLRMANVVEKLEPGSKDPWTVRDTISGWDKGRKINTWDVRLASGLQETLSNYINGTWRSKYERWQKDSKGKPKLQNGFLFPCNKWHLRDKPVDVSQIVCVVRRVLKRAGIEGPNAHPHACRKGFSTDLLRANNPGHVVAKALHHQSERTTFRHYDQRSRTEILSNLRLPSHWESLSCEKENQHTGDDQHPETVGGVSTAAENALLEEMTMNSVLRRQMAIIMPILTEEQRQTYEAMCNAESITPAPPLPQ